MPLERPEVLRPQEVDAPAVDTAPGCAADWLAWASAELAAHSDSNRADAEFLLAATLGCERSALRGRADQVLEAATVLRFVGWVERRKLGEPVAYITARCGFWSLELVVDTSVLIPRPDTEALVEWALQRLPIDSTASVLDLGTGSGAIALSIARERPCARVVATDLSQASLDTAIENAKLNGIDNVAFHCGRWFDALLQNPLPPAEGGARDSQAPETSPEGVVPHPRPSPGRRAETTCFELIVSNPPYIAEGDAHLAALRYEPRLALTSGADGLDAIRHIVAAAPAHLTAGGALLLEHGAEQAAAVRALLAAAGFAGIETRRDFGGNERVTLGIAGRRA
jgi:release factor glutamine methyltransferase